MSDPKKRRSVSWAPVTRSTESQETNWSTRSTKNREVVSWAPHMSKNGLQETKLPLIARALCFSLEPKKQRLEPKKQQPGSPPWPGNDSASSTCFDSLRFDSSSSAAPPLLRRPTPTRRPILPKGDVVALPSAALSKHPHHALSSFCFCTFNLLAYARDLELIARMLLR